MDQTLEVINKTVAKTYDWVGAVVERADLDDLHDGFQVLRAVLHALRDRVEPDVAAHLAAQLPLLLRGVFYEGWDPGRSLQRSSVTEFLARVEREAGLKGTSEAEDATRAVITVIGEEAGYGTVDHLAAVLPKEFGTFL
ncbi:MAG TPA: DUF2267 domain-containing protein [Acidimicrobiales bacterium]|nr:DUF2267 domain-containing protein [Acidimicrobiales bacterium]